jgi:hypothetical protein
MGTVGLALVVAGPASAEDSKPATTQKKVETTTTTTIEPGHPAYRPRATFEPRFSEL